MERDRRPATPGVWAHRQWTPLAHALAAAGDRWTLLIVVALGCDTLRLTRLRERLPGISSGVLDHHVHRLATLGVLVRRRMREVPPRVEVELSQSGRELLPIAGALARWGMRHLWFSPDGQERVQVDLLLSLLPLLLEEDVALPDGTVEANVASDDDRASHLFQVQQGRLQAADDAVDAASTTARIQGDEAAWIAALGPARDYSGLQLTGKRKLARQVLDALPRRC